MIKKGDYVVVREKGAEVFMVIGVEKDLLALSNGTFKYIKECIKVPNKYKEEIYSVIHDYIPGNIWLKILKIRDRSVVKDSGL